MVVSIPLVKTASIVDSTALANVIAVDLFGRLSPSSRLRIAPTLTVVSEESFAASSRHLKANHSRLTPIASRSSRSLFGCGTGVCPSPVDMNAVRTSVHSGMTHEKSPEA